jgi:hypothetical protein
MVVVDTLLSRSTFLVPKEGAWSVRADQLAGGSVGVTYDGARRLFRFGPVPRLRQIHQPRTWFGCIELRHGAC